MKKLLALTIVAGSAIGMATACGGAAVSETVTKETTEYFLGHGAKASGVFGTISQREQNDYYNVIKAEVKVEDGKIIKADVSESAGYIKASANNVTIQKSALARTTTDVTATQFNATKTATYGALAYEAKIAAYKALEGNADKTTEDYLASDEYQADFAAFKVKYHAGESTRYVYALVSVPSNKVANIQASYDDATVKGFIAKDETTYPGFKFDLLKEKTEALFTGKTCTSIKNYKFDTRIKSVGGTFDWTNQDTAVTGATASETTLYASALYSAAINSCIN